MTNRVNWEGVDEEENAIITSNFSLTLGVFNHRAYQQQKCGMPMGSKMKNIKILFTFLAAFNFFPLLSLKVTINVNWRGKNGKFFIFTLKVHSPSDNVIVVAFNAFESRNWGDEENNNKTKGIMMMIMGLYEGFMNL